MTIAFPKNAPMRLKGKKLENLRRSCFERDEFHCRECGVYVLWLRDLPDSGEMAHVIGRGRNGPDTLDNVRTLCGRCHRNEHNAGGKPCPKKVGQPCAQ